MLLLSLLHASTAAEPAPPAANPPAAAPAPALKTGLEDGRFQLLDAGIWKPERERWCSLVDLAEAPERAGAHIRVALELSGGVGKSNVQVWHFYDAQNALTLTSTASACLTAVRPALDPGWYTWAFDEPTDLVGRDPSVDAAASQDPAFTACRAQYPGTPLNHAMTVATVLDGGKIWTSSGTRDEKTLRGCMGAAQDAWVKAQAAAGALHLVEPAVIFGTMPAEAMKPSGKPVK